MFWISSFCSSQCHRFVDGIQEILWQAYKCFLFRWRNVCGFQRLVRVIVSCFQLSHRMPSSPFFPCLSCCPDGFQGKNVKGYNMEDYHMYDRLPSRLELGQRLIRTPHDEHAGLYGSTLHSHNLARYVASSIPNIRSHLCGPHSPKNFRQCSCAWLPTGSRLVESNEDIEHPAQQLALPGNVCGFQLFENSLALVFENRWMVTKRASVFEKERQFFGIDLLQFFSDLINGVLEFRIKHGGLLILGKSAVGDKILSAYAVDGSRRWVRAGSVFHHTFSPLYLELWGLTNFLFRHLLDFILCFRRILEIKLKSTQHLAVQRAAVILGTLYQGVVDRLFIISETNGYSRNHGEMVSPYFHYVKV